MKTDKNTDPALPTVSGSNSEGSMSGSSPAQSIRGTFATKRSGDQELSPEEDIMSNKKTKKTNPKNTAKNTAQNGKKEKPEKKDRIETILVSKETATVPGISGAPDLSIPVDLFQVNPAVLETLVAKGVEITDEEIAKLHPTRKVAMEWLKVKRAEAKGMSPSRLVNQGRALYRATKIIDGVYNQEKVEVSDKDRAKLSKVRDLLDEVSEAFGFDAAAWETAQHQKKVSKKNAA